VATFVLALVFGWNEYLFAFLFTATRTKTAPVILSEMLGSATGVEWGPLFAATTLQLIPMLIVVWLVQGALLRGMTAGAVKGVRRHNGGNLEVAMAILNVKNVPDRLYRKLRDRARRQHRSISQEVVHLLSQALDEQPVLSILELKGLGKTRWRGMDPATHVARERRSWD
jgi:plasmid stability protein